MAPVVLFNIEVSWPFSDLTGFLRGMVLLAQWQIMVVDIAVPLPTKYTPVVQKAFALVACP